MFVHRSAEAGGIGKFELVTISSLSISISSIIPNYAKNFKAYNIDIADSESSDGFPRSHDRINQSAPVNRLFVVQVCMMKHLPHPMFRNRAILAFRFLNTLQPGMRAF